MKNPDAILTADLHLREDRPQCRTDDYWATQDKKMKWLWELQIKYNCPILDAGDIFNKNKPSPYLLQWAIRNFPKPFFTIPGNHDLPNHNLENYEKSGVCVLDSSHTINFHPFTQTTNFNIWSVPWEANILSGPMLPKFKNDINVLLVHIMTWTGREPYSGANKDGNSALSLLKKYKQFDLIVTGHNHRSFTIEHEGRLLVNPGSMMRMSADQIDHKPCGYLWYAKENKVEQVYYPIEQGVISREHIDVKEKREGRISAFVNRLKDNVEIGLSFEKNIEQYFLTNKEVHPKTKDIIQETLGGE